MRMCLGDNCKGGTTRKTVLRPLLVSGRRFACLPASIHLSGGEGKKKKRIWKTTKEWKIMTCKKKLLACCLLHACGWYENPKLPFPPFIASWFLPCQNFLQKYPASFPPWMARVFFFFLREKNVNLFSVVLSLFAIESRASYGEPLDTVRCMQSSC